MEEAAPAAAVQRETAVATRAAAAIPAGPVALSRQVDSPPPWSTVGRSGEQSDSEATRPYHQRSVRQRVEMLDWPPDTVMDTAFDSLSPLPDLQLEAISIDSTWPQLLSLVDPRPGDDAGMDFDI